MKLSSIIVEGSTPCIVNSFPEKQGLKLHAACCAYAKGVIVNSFPEKQGLKPDAALYETGALVIVNSFPEKQGLKLWRACCCRFYLSNR